MSRGMLFFIVWALSDPCCRLEFGLEYSIILRVRLDDYDFELPAELIAQEPLADRSGSRMLVVNRAARRFSDARFADLTQYLRPTDVLVLNNTKVFPARLLGTTDSGASVEIFLVENLGDGRWSTLAKPARRLKSGKLLQFADGLTGEVIDKLEDGCVVVRFESAGEFDSIIDAIGRTPLPPYIKRGHGTPDADRERYQTVYAKNRGAIAAPTAGLHFTPQTIDDIRQIGVTVAEITLHVGYGTFEPVRVDDLSRHSVHPEKFEISAETAELLNNARSGGRRIVAVGTTTTRALETSMARHGRFAAEIGLADLTIRPSHRYAAVDALLTNFHLPKSSLLVLVSTFGGHDLIMSAYEHAVGQAYRFYSYGDCMLIV